MAIRACGPGQDPVDVAVTMRTPGHEDELAVGFLRTEGLIDDATEVVGITRGDPATHAQPDDEVTVHLARPFDATPRRGAPLRRHRLVRDLRQGVARRGRGPLRSDPGGAGRSTRRCSSRLPERLREAQAVFEATGGLHAAGLFDDDRRARRAARGRRPPQRAGQAGREPGAGRARCRSTTGSCSCSGRASFELVQKAAVAGVPILAAVSAPSDLAVEAAERLGVTLVGFLRGDGFNVYAHAERIALGGR